MAGKNSKKDQEMAADLKKRGVERKTGQCPNGCGYGYRVNSDNLVTHLNVCRGRRRLIR